MRIVVVGAGLAGVRLAARLSPHQVTLVSGDPGGDRALLCDVLAGRLSTEDIGLPVPDGVSVHRGTATAVDRANRLLWTEDGSGLPYDALVLATGSTPVRPRWADGRGYGVHGVADAAPLLDALRVARRVVVVGGGPLGVETAVTLAEHGRPVTLVHRHPRLLPAWLDDEGGEALRRLVTTRGVEVRLSTEGSTVDGDLVVLACGIRPHTALAASAGLVASAGTGIPVDDTLRTVDPAVYAIGDCAAHPGASPGHAASAWDQADVLADRLAGVDVRYRGTPRVVRLRARLFVTAAGRPRAVPGDRVVTLADEARGSYQRLVVRDRRLVGLVAIGRHDATPGLLDWFRDGTPVPAATRDFASALRA